MASVDPLSLFASLEPPCWGSGELPLIPERLRDAVKGSVIKGLQAKTKKGRQSILIRLSDLAEATWSKKLGHLVPGDASLSLLDFVGHEIERVYQERPDCLDVPLGYKRFDSYTATTEIPFEVRTWELLSSVSLTSDLDIALLLTSTFREILDRIGDGRAALDISVTGNSWVQPNQNGQYRIALSQQPISLEGAISLARRRAFRCLGWDVAAKTYTFEMAELVGKRQAIGKAKRATLAECADELGVTRERFRQIEGLMKWPAAARRWPKSELLDRLDAQLVKEDEEAVIIASTLERVSREDAISLLVSYSYPIDRYLSLNKKLEVVGADLGRVKFVAYRESENTGLLTLVELKYHLKNQFPSIGDELLEEVIKDIVSIGDLPHGYLYLEGQKGSALTNWLVSLLEVLGPQRIDEALLALERFFRVRRPGLVFPPRPVLEAFIQQSSLFAVHEDIVTLTSGHTRELIGVERWFQDTIKSCSGQVIHRTELWNRAREAKVKAGTISVYASYSLYFKPLKGGLVTLTGHNPSETMRDLARKRASAIRVPMRRLGVTISNGCLTIRVQVGNSLLDSGVLGTTLEIRKMLKDQKFSSTTNGSQHGSISWSGNSMIGFSGALQSLGVTPGDVVDFKFCPEHSEMTAEFAT